jgi:hypothetical protein
MPSIRCQCHTNTGLVCKLQHQYTIEGKRYCAIHSKKLYNKKVSMIQSVYRGYKNREKLNILFKPLPREIQCIVLKYLKEPYYLNRYNKSITKILSNRVDNIKHLAYLPSHLDNNSNYHIYTKYYEDFIYLYDLYSKYNSITDTYYDHQLKNIVHKIWNIFIKQIREERLFNKNNENIVLNDTWHEIHKRLYTSLINFQNIYNNNYPEFWFSHNNNNIIYYIPIL